MPSEAHYQFPVTMEPALARCWRKASPPAEWQLTEERFRKILARSVSQKFSGKPAEGKALENYLESLHLPDLALAAACSSGNASAWDIFMVRYRPELHRAARAIAGESQGRDLADSLYAELFGLRESDGERKSLFDYFHGRSKLGTWLRAILAQRHVDQLRRSARIESLEDNGEDSPSAMSSHPSTAMAANDPERDHLLAILQVAVTTVIAALDSRDRLRLAYYYINELTLAQIGKLLGEHEATVSRKLERTRRELRLRVEERLQREKKLSEAQLAQCFEYAREAWPFDLSATLSADK